MFDPMDFFATGPVKSPQEVIREQMRGMPAPAAPAPPKKAVRSSSISQTAKNDSEGNPAPQPVSGQEMLPRAVAAQKRPIAAQSEGSGDRLEDYGSDLYSRRAKMEEELASTLGDPDYSKMTQYAKDRSERGERDLMLAMAAGLGGEETKPIGAMFLKQAAEARNPIKVATGLIDENGQYIEDAEAVQERKGKRIDARIKSLDTLIASNISAQEKREARIARDQLTREMKMLTAGIASSNNDLKRTLLEGQIEDLKTKRTAAEQKTSAPMAELKSSNGLLDMAEPLIAKATGSGVGAAVDAAGNWVGMSSESGDAAAQLRSIEGMLVSKMPKMSGPQSDKDVLLYKQMAGQIGDPMVPASKKSAALATIREINARQAAIIGGQPYTPPGSAPATQGYSDPGKEARYREWKAKNGIK
jgi:hypothetical protein